jgi:hypothetical protein
MLAANGGGSVGAAEGGAEERGAPGPWATLGAFRLGGPRAH